MPCHISRNLSRQNILHDHGACILDHLHAFIVAGSLVFWGFRSGPVPIPLSTEKQNIGCYLDVFDFWNAEHIRVSFWTAHCSAWVPG